MKRTWAFRRSTLGAARSSYLLHSHRNCWWAAVQTSDMVRVYCVHVVIVMQRNSLSTLIDHHASVICTKHIREMFKCSAVMLLVICLVIFCKYTFVLLRCSLLMKFSQWCLVWPDCHFLNKASLDWILVNWLSGHTGNHSETETVWEVGIMSKR